MYLLQPFTKTAYRLPLLVTKTRHVHYVGSTESGQPIPAVEAPPVEIPPGLVVLHRPSTLTSFPDKDSAPITIPRDTWWAPELDLLVFSKYTYPGKGDYVEKVTNISRAEPDPSLFRPPADYTIVDKNEDFRLVWGN